MTLILSGTDGLSDVDGSAATPAIRGTDANTGIFFPAADTIAFSEGGVESMRIDSAGNMGLGVTPSAWKSNYKAIQYGSYGSALYGRTDSLVAGLSSNFYENSGGSDIYISNGYATRYQQASGAHSWLTAASGTAGNTISFTQAMTLTADGNLGVGTTSPSALLTVSKNQNSQTEIGVTNSDTTNSSSRARVRALCGTIDTVMTSISGLGSFVGASSNHELNLITNGVTRALIDTSGNLLVGGTTVTNSAKMEAFFSGATSNGIVSNDTSSTASTTYFMCSNNGTNIGSITRVASTSAVSYNTTSDQRLKSNIEDAAPVIDKLMSVQVRQYDWTEGDLHQDYGFVAQELEPILSGIVSKGKTEEDMWQMDYSRLTPHLVKAIQEQQALITTLTDRITALEAK